ncbi:MAG: response regulator [Anaerolineae bacterium]|jgi:CheY-like chemotaxis protein
MMPKDWQILVVEDEYDSIQMVSKILQHSGIAVEIAHNGLECLEALKRRLPTLIIMDLALPVMDGWETLHHIRSNPETAHLPVVAITAYHSVNLEDDAYKAGFNAYMPKPLETQALVKHLERIIHHS